MIKNILFDLDGTLLPMDQDKFIKIYLMTLYEYFPNEYKDVMELSNIIMYGVKLMVENNGSLTNEQVFYNYFKNFKKERTDELLKKHIEYYNSTYIKAKDATSMNPYANLIIKTLKEKGYNLILATNPLFPKEATLNRIKWAGLDYKDFTYITTYENSCYSKPNIKYYQDILNKLNLKSEECLMIGNDTTEDYIITELNIPCIILKDCLINKKNLDIDFTTLKDLYEAIKNYPNIKK